MIGPRVALVGAGGIGQKRAANLAGATLVVCCDSILERAEGIARRHPGATATTDWKSVVARTDIDIVIVSTTHDMLPRIGEAAAVHGKHLLIEKPGARRAEELDRLAATAQETGSLIRLGFNHRYHRAIQKARALFDSGVLGDPFYIRGRYGHGGRIGYEKEWRAVPEVSGGGEAIDQGIHLIDLARWFLGDFPKVQGCVQTFFWNMPVEDNAFFLLQSSSGSVASLHASWTEWKNLFSFEIFCRNGKLEISGLGGSYGTESLRYYQMLPEMGPPDTVIYEYPAPDDSWEREFSDFLEDIRLKRQPRPGIADAQAALRIIEQIYKEQQA